MLLLEDDAATRLVFGESLRNAGHTVHECDSVERALTVLRTTSIDLLVIDLLIGNANSLGIAQYAGYAAPNAKVILVTGSGKFPEGEIMSDYPWITWILRKPLLVTDLEAIVSYAERRYLDVKVKLAS